MTRPSRQSQSIRVWVYCIGVLVGGFALGAHAIRTVDAPPGQPFQLHWVIFAVLFVLAEAMQVDVEVKREALTLTFTEAPLTLGLLLADPTELIVVRVCIAAAAVWYLRRPPLVKLLFNTGQFAIEASTALLVFQWILNGQSPIEPFGWFATVVAVVSSYLLAALCVTAVIMLAGARPPLRSQLVLIGTALAATVAGSAVALGAAATLWRDGRSWVLLLITGAVLAYFYVRFGRIRERHQSLATLHEFTTSLAQSAGDDLEERAARGIADLLAAYRVVLLVGSPDGRIARIECVDGEVTTDPDHAVDDLDWATALGTVGQRPGHHDAELQLAGVALANSSVISVRLPLGDAPGLVLVDGRLSSAERAFDDEDLRLLETAAGHAATAFHNHRLVTELRQEARIRAHQALHDDLTALPNTRGLTENVGADLASGIPHAILTVRIDSLREVNETLGRSVGNDLLRAISKRLRSVEEVLWCAKTAADEFSVVVEGGRAEADAVAGEVLRRFDDPVQCGEVILAVTVGIGVALAPAHGTDTEILLRRASLAASRSQVDGTRVSTWAVDRDPYDPQRLALAAELRDAVESGQIEVHYQPQVDIGSGLVTGAEALVRWNHPRMGELQPGQFIAAAEYTGAIDMLTHHILQSAARTRQQWEARGWDLEIGVNVSARNLQSPTFASDVRGILIEENVDPARITLELTESLVMNQAGRAAGVLTALQRLGVALSIDDFGTGFSSLAHLRTLPIDEIKIDKSFVFDLTTSPKDEAIVRSMIDLGHNLGMTVVAEGVETPEVRRRLQDLGVDRIQGYLLSRAMPQPAFEQWIADRPVRMVDDDMSPRGRLSAAPDPSMARDR